MVTSFTIYINDYSINHIGTDLERKIMEAFSNSNKLFQTITETIITLTESVHALYSRYVSLVFIVLTFVVSIYFFCRSKNTPFSPIKLAKMFSEDTYIIIWIYVQGILMVYAMFVLINKIIAIIAKINSS